MCRIGPSVGLALCWKDARHFKSNIFYCYFINESNKRITFLEKKAVKINWIDIIKELILKFIYYEKATKFCEISTVDLSYVVSVKSKFCGLLKKYINFNSKIMQNLSKINHNRKLSMALELFSIEMQFHKSIFPDLYSFCKSIRSSKVSLIWNRIFFLDAALRERIIIKKKQTDILNLTDNRFFYK